MPNITTNHAISIGNSMICSDIWHERYFKTVKPNFTRLTAREI